MKVLLIEDDVILGESVKEFLEREGFSVRWISDERDLIDIGVVRGYDVVVLDLILRFRAGEDILKEIKRKAISTPVLILTAKSTLEDKEICFNLGADDYLTKPFEPRELVLRIRALVRRSGYDTRYVEIGNVRIDLEGRSIWKNGKEVRVSKTAWSLLELLLKNRGKVVNTETILNCVWEDKPVGTDVVRAYVKELRKVLPPESIKTYKGIGYKLV